MNNQSNQPDIIRRHAQAFVCLQNLVNAHLQNDPCSTNSYMIDAVRIVRGKPSENELKFDFPPLKGNYDQKQQNHVFEVPNSDGMPVAMVSAEANELAGEVVILPLKSTLIAITLVVLALLLLTGDLIYYFTHK